jgi:hypothetical protein
VTVIGQTTTTVGEEKHYNPRLTKPLDEFIKIMENLNLPYPKMIGKSEVVKLFLLNSYGEIKKKCTWRRQVPPNCNYPQDYIMSQPTRPQFKPSHYRQDFKIQKLHFV